MAYPNSFNFAIHSCPHLHCLYGGADIRWPYAIEVSFNRDRTSSICWFYIRNWFFFLFECSRSEFYSVQPKKMSLWLSRLIDFPSPFSVPIFLKNTMFQVSPTAVKQYSNDCSLRLNKAKHSFRVVKWFHLWLFVSNKAPILRIAFPIQMILQNPKYWA